MPTPQKASKKRTQYPAEFDALLKKVGTRIKETRSYRFKSHIADTAELDASRYAKIEEGKINFTMETLVRIAKALNVDPSEFFSSKKNP